MQPETTSAAAEVTAWSSSHQFGVCHFIKANCSVAPIPTLPEIRLHRAGPRSGLWRLAELDDDFGSPYWAYLWGGGLALARHVLDHPEIVVGRSILDLGCGSGLVGIAAAKSGAKKVIAADVDPYAIAATGLNAGANAVKVLPIVGDLTERSPPAVDIVLVGDLFYEQVLAQRVLTFLDRCVRSNVSVLIGDPGRVFLPRSRLEVLAEYPGPDFAGGHRVAQTQNAVFSLRPRESDDPHPPLKSCSRDVMESRFRGKQEEHGISS